MTLSKLTLEATVWNEPVRKIDEVNAGAPPMLSAPEPLKAPDTARVRPALTRQAWAAVSVNALAKVAPTADPSRLIPEDPIDRTPAPLTLTVPEPDEPVMRTPCQVTFVPRVRPVASDEPSQLAMSEAPGAAPPTQLAPSTRSVPEPSLEMSAAGRTAAHRAAEATRNSLTGSRERLGRAC